MRGRCGAWIAAAALAAVASPAAAAALGRRAAVLFVPGPVLTQPGLSLGITGPTLGGYKRPQLFVDISQGARISTRAYTRRLPALRLEVADGRWRVAGWGSLVRRAHDAPGDIVPGLLATTIARAGGSVAYAGVAGAEDTEAFSAADEAGRIGRVSIGPAAGFGAWAAALWRSSSLLVARLPSSSALPDLLRARRPQDLVVVVQAPPPKPLTLLYTGAVGPGLTGGVIRSGTTRRDGYIAAPDISATVLHTLGMKVPKKMQGERIESRSGHGSHLTGLSIAGPNPKGGSRFFGIGNELEIILALTVLLGTGAALTLLPERVAPRVFAGACLVAAVVIGAGRLGADVGGVITLGAGGAAAVVMSLPRGPTPRAIALAVIVPVLAVGALVLLDLPFGARVHP